jgi:ferredoxin-NADP reductase
LALHIAAAGAIVAYSGKHRVQLFTILVIWWAVDGLLRYGLGSLIRLPKTATLSLLHARRKAKSEVRVVELSFNGKFNYTAGQYIRIAVMETGQPIMFHPMTISSAPYEDQVTVHFRPFGGWTRQLANMRARKGSSRISGKVHVLLEGPYGNLSLNLFENSSRYPVVVLIGGGIGITPLSSLARQLLHEHEHSGRERKKILVVWAVRDLGLVEALPILGQEDDEGIDLSSTVMADPWRRLQRNKARDGLVKDQVADSVRQSFRSTSVFEASIYVTRQNKQGVSRRLEEAASFNSHDGRFSRKHGTPEGDDGVEDDGVEDDGVEDDGVELGKRGVPDYGVEGPLPRIKPPHTYVKSDSTWSSDERYSFFTGRPDVKFILQHAATSTRFVKNQGIAVIACGPRALVQDAKQACAQLSGTVPMDFHEEVFRL